MTCVRAWNHFWFKPAPSHALEAIRIGLGLSFVWHGVALIPQLSYFYSDSGPITLESLEPFRSYPWHQSLLYYMPGVLGLYVFHAVAVLGSVAFTVGWQTRVSKWVVLITQISYLHRNPAIYYGVDNIGIMLLFACCLAPLGRHWALDARSAPGPVLHWRNRTAIRFVQIQMCILYLYAGLEKLRGTMWWSGDAVWVAMTNWEFARLDPAFYAKHYWLINLLTYGSLVFEIGYAFWIWHPKRRIWLILGSFGLHYGIAIMMGLWHFAWVVSLGNLAFLFWTGRRPWFISGSEPEAVAG